MSTPLCQITHHKKNRQHLREETKTNYVSLSARRSRCERRTSGVRRSNRCQQIKTNWWKLSKTTDLSLFVCLELWNPTKQLLFVCLELSKPNQPTFVCLLRAHKLAQLKVAATPAYSNSQSKTSFFYPQACFLAWGCHLHTLCPILLTLAAQTFQWRNDFVLFSTFQ